ncbi:MAG: TetR family transcriptional regulator C-terminal domain-containing protein [Pseudomonas sp.]|nr:TetR family transcriptional regulator C-terminal domain-containing protein [Pseudomonas sp.]
MNATPTPAKPTRSPKQSRQEIMDNIRAAAISEFSQHGFIGASTQAIAERAGLKKSQLHYYIEDKESLYAQVLGQLMNAWSKLFVFGAQDSATPRQILGEYVRQKLEFALDHPEISRIFTNELLSGGTRLEGFWPGALSTTQSKVDRLQTWVDQGILRPLNPRLLIMHIWALTQYYADYALQAELILGQSLQSPEQQREILDELVTFVLAGCHLKD